MEDLLAAILEVLAEVLIQLAGEFGLSVLSRAAGKFFTAIFELSPMGAAVAVVLLGFACGECSVVIFPHPLVHPSRFHGISLIVSPVLTGLAMSLVGRFLRSRGKRTIQLETFAYGFAFAFAMAVIRLFFVK